MQPISEIKLDSLKIDTPLLKTGIEYNVDSYPSFTEAFDHAMGDLNTLQQEAKNKIEDFTSGKTANVAEVMLSLEKASTATDLALQIRNRLVDGYQEVLRMQL
jgi:flagellar hook-basal body complex protein FliE